MNWSKPFDQRHRRGPARPRLRHRHQGGDLADHVGRDRQRLRRRLGHALLRHHRHGPGLRHRHGADGRRGAQHAGRIACGWCRATPTSRPTTWARSARARCSTWATPCAAPPRTPATSSRRWRARSASRRARNIPIAELFQKRYGMQAGNVIGTGIYKPDYMPPAPGTGQSPNVTPFWMIARRRRRGRGRHRDRPRQDHQAGQRRRLRQGDQSEERARRRFPAPR